MQHVVPYLCRFARGECNMLVPTCAVCPGVPVNPALHLQSVGELASPDVSLLIGQLDECNMLVRTCARLPGSASELSFTPAVCSGLASPAVSGV